MAKQKGGEIVVGLDIGTTKIAAGQGIDYPQLCERILLGASLQA